MKLKASKKPTKVDWLDFARVAFGAWDVPPSEFWQMSPMDFWLVFDGKRRKQEAAERPRHPIALDEYKEFREQVYEAMDRKGIPRGDCPR